MTDRSVKINDWPIGRSVVLLIMRKPTALEAILQSSIGLVRDKGLDGWSIERVAKAAHCAKALVVHHYLTRPGLLRATGARIAEMRLGRRLGSLAPGGTVALDALWLTIVDDAETGMSKAAFALAAHLYPTRQSNDAAALHSAIARALDVPRDVLAEPVAVMAMLEGLEFQLVQDVEPAAVRPSFDRLWVTLIDPV